jgi:hypothetical protein
LERLLRQKDEIVRVKSLLLASVAIFLSLLLSEAQNIYSENVVGYANISLTNGFNLVANNFDFDGTGTNNTIDSVVGTNMPNGTKVYAFSATAGGYSSATFLAASRTWGGSNAVAIGMQPGNAFWLRIGPTVPLPQTLTTVGNVLVGTNMVPVAQNGVFQLMGSTIPVGGPLTTNLGYVPANADKTFQWDPVAQSWTVRTYSARFNTWAGGVPLLRVGEGFWLISHSNASWTQILINTNMP